VEKKLAEFQGQARTFPQLNRALAAIHYYLHFAVGTCQNQWYTKHRGITNFGTLLLEIERWRYERKEQVCFVTFNYDTMLEEAMSQVLRLEVRDMGSYYGWENYSLFKLHGSVNWGRVVEGNYKTGHASNFYQHLIDTVVPGSVSITDRYQLCDLEMNPTPPATFVVLYPALSIPVENKDEFSCPVEHLMALDGMLPKVTKMITIGWRATEADFLARLQLSRAAPVAGIRQALRLLVVSGSQEGTQETLGNLAPYRGGYDPHMSLDRQVPTGFTGLINNLATLRDFLCIDLH
jgi:hypothetical protein